MPVDIVVAAAVGIVAKIVLAGFDVFAVGQDAVVRLELELIVIVAGY